MVRKKIILEESLRRGGRKIKLDKERKVDVQMAERRNGEKIESIKF